MTNLTQGTAIAEGAVYAELPEAVIDAVAAALGEARDCFKVWSAWSYNTMHSDDFSMVAEDGERVAEIASAAIGAYLAPHGQAPAGATEPWQQHMANQVEVICCEALQRAMVQHGVSFPEGGMEYFRASLGEMVNRFVRFAAPAAPSAPDSFQGRVERHSDQSVLVVFPSCRLASEFERSLLPASPTIEGESNGGES